MSIYIYNYKFRKFPKVLFSIYVVYVHVQTMSIIAYRIPQNFIIMIDNLGGFRSPHATNSLKV